MAIDEKGIQFLKDMEGLRLQIYEDVAGLQTIGIGHLLTASDKATGRFNNDITEGQAQDLLRADLEPVEACINALGVSLTQNQFDALASLIFNIGTGNFAASTVKRCLLAGNLQGASDAFMLWNKAHVNGQLVVSHGLTNRRQAEIEQFNS